MLSKIGIASDIKFFCSEKHDITPYTRTSLLQENWVKTYSESRWNPEALLGPLLERKHLSAEEERIIGSHIDGVAFHKSAIAIDNWRHTWDWNLDAINDFLYRHQPLSFEKIYYQSVVSPDFLSKKELIHYLQMIAECSIDDIYAELWLVTFCQRSYEDTIFDKIPGSIYYFHQINKEFFIGKYGHFMQAWFLQKFESLAEQPTIHYIDDIDFFKKMSWEEIKAYGYQNVLKKIYLKNNTDAIDEFLHGLSCLDHPEAAVFIYADHDIDPTLRSKLLLRITTTSLLTCSSEVLDTYFMWLDAHKISNIGSADDAILRAANMLFKDSLWYNSASFSFQRDYQNFCGIAMDNDTSYEMNLL